MTARSQRIAHWPICHRDRTHTRWLPLRPSAFEPNGEPLMRKTCLGVLLLIWPSLLQAQEPRFIRLKERDGQATALEVAVTRYASKDKSVTVDLVGVVHLGDRVYYKKLNERFEQYEAVLYELVAPPGTQVPKGGKS